MPETDRKQNALTPGQAEFIYWFNGIMPVLTNVVTPIVTFWSCRRNSISSSAKYNQVITEIARQFVSGTLGLFAYFGGGEMARNVMNWAKPQETKGQSPSAPRELSMIIGAGLMGFVAYSFVRPFVATKLVSEYLIQKSPQELKALKHKILESSGSRLAPSLLSMKLKLGMNSLMDKHFAANSEHPLIGKAAWVSTGLLGFYLCTLIAGIKLLDKISGQKAVTQNRPVSSPPDQFASPSLGKPKMPDSYLPLSQAALPRPYFSRINQPPSTMIYPGRQALQAPLNPII